MNHSSEITCVILCGGKSSRMKEDKALLSFDTSSTLTKYQYDRLKPYFKKVYISSKTNKFDFLDEKDLILDKNEEHSPIIALQAIFEKLKNQKIFIITVDNPLVSIKSINKLINESTKTNITVASTQRVHNLCGVFNSNILNNVNDMIKNDIHKVGFLLKQTNTNIIEFKDENEFINLNTKEDYQKALSIIE